MGKTRKNIVVTIMMLAVLAIFLMPFSSMAGNLEPSGSPAPTMKTLDEVPPTWSQKLPAADRFELVLDGEAVLDKETGLVWAKNANLFGILTWSDAIAACYETTIGGRKGWRIPTMSELTSLLDPTRSSPSLPLGHPFINVQNNWYHSGTIDARNTNLTWLVSWSGNGFTNSYAKSLEKYVWPVRGGN
jgi:hypothetical protein